MQKKGDPDVEAPDYAYAIDPIPQIIRHRSVTFQDDQPVPQLTRSIALNLFLNNGVSLRVSGRSSAKTKDPINV
jgi:hypothetical protein